jgi:hypothetical protein
VAARLSASVEAVQEADALGVSGVDDDPSLVRGQDIPDRYPGDETNNRSRLRAPDAARFQVVADGLARDSNGFGHLTLPGMPK